MDPEPRRADPVRHLRSGPRGRPGRHRLGLQARSRLDRPVLSLDRHVPHVRDEPARHPDRAVRDRQRPELRRSPDARPLRLARAQPRERLLAGGDAAAPRRRDRARGQGPQDRPGRDDEHGGGEQQPGRRPRGPELRGDPQAAVHLRRREQRLRDQRPDGTPGVEPQRGRSCRGLRHPGRDRGRQRRPGLLRGGA